MFLNLYDTGWYIHKRCRDMREYAVWFPIGGCTDRVVESGSRTGHVREEGRILSGLDGSSHGSLCGMRMAFGTALDQMVDKTNESIKAARINFLLQCRSSFMSILSWGRNSLRELGSPENCLRRIWVSMYVEGDPLGRLGTGSPECMFDE